MFNEGRYAERAEPGGDLRMIVKKSRITEMTYIRNWVVGTESQEVHFLDQNDNVVAKAHRFLRPDGLLAASGKIDPKRLFENGKWYALTNPEK